MGKTRSCRRTEDENKIHDKAVKMRKMTDDKLLHYVEDWVDKSRCEGLNQVKKAAPAIDTDKILEKIGTIKGIGAVKLQKIKGILEQCK